MDLDPFQQSLLFLVICCIRVEQDARIIGLHWYDGAEGTIDPQAPSLAVAFEFGKVQLSRSPDDERPIILDAKMRLTQVRETMVKGRKFR